MKPQINLKYKPVRYEAESAERTDDLVRDVNRNCEQTTILCIGDSIVEGYPYDLEDSWVSHAEQIQSRAGMDELWVNAGISGQTTGEIRSRFGRTMDRWDPDLVILSCGTNDFIFLEGERGEPVSAWTNIRAMADAALERGAKVIIAAPPLTISRLAARRWSDGTDYAEVNRKLKELRRRIREWCKERTDGALRENCGEDWSVQLWDVQGAFVQWCGEGTAEEGTEEAKLEERHFVDGLHPTREGYRRMAEHLCELLVYIESAGASIK